MSEVVVGEGKCLGFGGTNARVANCKDGDISGFTSVETPTRPREFFSWMSRQVLMAADGGAKWVVAGFPGPVSPDGRLVGPLTNVSGMDNKRYDLHEELVAADPAVARALNEGLLLLSGNDGDLAAHAAASRIGRHKYGKTGAVILGTGVGAGVVEKDPNYQNVHRADRKNPYEIGHLLLGPNVYDRFEDSYSGPGIAHRYQVEDARMLDADHMAWEDVGHTIGRLAGTMGLIGGVELVVPTGGVGAGASDKHSPHVESFMARYREYGNGPQRQFAPELAFVDPAEAQVFELFGAEGMVRDALTAPLAA